MPRSKIQVIGIPQNDLRAEIFRTKIFQDVLRDSLDRASRADRHESRGIHRAMRGVDAAKTGRAGLGLDGERKSHKSLWYRLFLKFRAQRGIPTVNVCQWIIVRGST